MTPAGQAPVPPAGRMGVFIDADNLNDATALDHVFAVLQERSDRIVYKRAYGRTESLRTIEPVLWRHGVRPVANMVVNKVTTDSALVIDAVEAVCSGAIDAFALCSGDADFVPLATWARERGCQVLCFSLSDRIFANPESFYDDVVLLEVVDTGEAQEKAATAVRIAARVPEAAPGSLVLEAPASAEVVEQVLAAFPALRTGQPQYLSQVVAVLRQQGLLNKATKTTAWFARWPSLFQLTPQPLPHQVTYLRPVVHAVAMEMELALTSTSTSAVVLQPQPEQPSLAASAPCRCGPHEGEVRVLAWHVAAPRQLTVPLPPPLHGLRRALEQLALQRIGMAAVLRAVPELLLCQPCTLAAVAGRLRERGLLRASQSALHLLQRNQTAFCLHPASAPQTVCYRGSASASD